MHNNNKKETLKAIIYFCHYKTNSKFSSWPTEDISILLGVPLGMPALLCVHGLLPSVSERWLLMYHNLSVI